MLSMVAGEGEQKASNVAPLFKEGRMEKIWGETQNFLNRG